MNKKTLACALATLMSVPFVAGASTVAIIDSGTDMKHQDIAPKAWINELETPDNNRDEDRNGYQDDIYGWNFAESNNQVIDYSYLGTLTPDIERFFEIQTKAMLGQATTEEIDWMRAQVADAEFVKRISIYGNFMHGTHVAGIAAKGAKDAKIMAVKLIPTEVKLPFAHLPSIEELDKGLGMTLLKKGLEVLASQQAKIFEEIGAYVDGHQADVANGSFGTGYPQAQMICGTLFKTLLRREPTAEELKEVTLHFLTATLENSRVFVESAPNTLFVFAAGNDGSNNDEFPASPTNIEAPNVISVAATKPDGAIASFSNYGLSTVDVAAPGVGIRSASPGNKYIQVSGTSQAAPFVANVAARLKDANPALTPVDMKAIIMKTVDKRDDLARKIRTSGLVNADRAVRAAQLAVKLSLPAAIAQSFKEVAPVALEKSVLPSVEVEGSVLPLPSGFSF